MGGKEKRKTLYHFLCSLSTPIMASTTFRISSRRSVRPYLLDRISNSTSQFPSQNRNARIAIPLSISKSNFRSFSTSTARLEASSSSSTSTILPESISNLITPLAPYLHDLPSTLHLSVFETSYPQAISILILTFLLRSTITLPISIWSRSRTRRMVELLLPEWNADKKKLPIQVLKRCRRAGKSYEEYQQELKAEVSSAFLARVDLSQ